MTPLLKAWKADADEFGIPETTQRGLAFMLALDLSVSPPRENQAEALVIMQNLSTIPFAEMTDGVGGNFYDGPIADLLAELTYRVDSDFSPRLVYTALDGDKIYAFKRPKIHRLPSFSANHMNLAVWDTLTSSLYHQIGEHIGDEVEGAYLAGHRFVAAYYPMDKKGMEHISRVATMFRPPHFIWFRHCLNFSPEQIVAGNPMQKILDCFASAVVCEQTPELYSAVCQFSDQLHYCGPGQKRIAVWEADLQSFTRLIVTNPLGLDKVQPQPEWLVANQRALAAQNFQPPPLFSSAEEATQFVRNQVLERWGYDVGTASEQLYAAEQWLRRCCVLFMCTANAFLRPDWNAALARG